MAHWVWLVPAGSAFGFVLTLFFGTRLRWRGAEICLFFAVASLAASTAVAGQWITGEGVPEVAHAEWFDWAGVSVTAGTYVDGLSAMMLMLVAVISLLVQVFSTSYMKDDRRFTHYFAIVSLFTAAMQWFVVSSNTLQALIGWELMGLCSFVLIGHWWEEKPNIHAAMKAFMTTRASDAGFILGIIVLFFAAGRSFDIEVINAAASAGTISHALLLTGAIALFIAVIGKSAQFPLHTWLPDAMAGPTPISALIHAATMVVAGVYLMARLFAVFDSAFAFGDNAVNLVAVVGAITIIIAAVLAFVQTDIKKILSYSTVSQLGYMVMAIGVGAWTAAVFHLFTHAFFKALLFLCSGSISHAVHGFDVEKDMGDLRKAMPITHATFAIGALALVGIIPLAGFWSKEQIVAQAGHNGYEAFAVVALVGTFLTAAYMMRCYYLVFWGRRRGPSNVHEAPPALTVPCVILALLSIGVGFLQAPALGIHLFEDWVAPAAIGQTSDDASILLPFTIELLVAVGGMALAVLAFALGFGPRRLAARSRLLNALYRFLENRYYLDWLYERVLVRGVRKGLALVVHWTDTNVVDGVVKDLAAVADGSGAAMSRASNGQLQRYIGALFVFVAAIVVGWVLL